jgi:phosphate transport system substrate-binding protein
MSITIITKIALTAVTTALTISAVEAREIKIVGSSTVFPYTQAVAEEFSRSGGAAPTVESTGTGGGMKIFCSGIGVQFPDITGASRAMKKSEKALCDKNGVSDVSEVLIGYDGLSIANSRKGVTFDLTKVQIYKALASKVPVDGKLVDNPYNMWSDIDAALPATAIIAYGPPPTSGTRDAFIELVFHHVCNNDQMDFWKNAKSGMDKKAFKKMYKLDCTAMRQDGPFIEAGENDNLIVQRLNADSSAVGIFGYSFLFENLDTLQAVKIAGVEPTMDTIGDGSYGISRPLYFYIKNAHRKVIKGMEEFIQAYVSDDAMGEDGYLSERGLVVLPEAELQASQAAALDAKTM